MSLTQSLPVVVAALAQPSSAVTLELSTEQLRYLWRVITNDVDDAGSLIRSSTFSQYGPVESEQIHNNVRIGATLLGQLPTPAPPSTQE